MMGRQLLKISRIGEHSSSLHLGQLDNLVAMKTFISTIAQVLFVLALYTQTLAHAQTKDTGSSAVSPYFTVQPHPGEKLYYLSFRTVAMSAPVLDRSLADSTGGESEIEVLRRAPLSI